MNKKIELKIDEKLEGKKIENILKSHLGLSGGIITKLKKRESVLLNGEITHCNRKVSLNDFLEITIYDEETQKIKEEKINLHVLYEDDELILINKPPYMLSHPDKKHAEGTLANALKGYYGKDFTPRIITRLDKDTSGVVLVAKNHLSAKILTSQMESGEIKKQYIAVICGIPKNKEGVIDLPIGKGEGIKRIVTPSGKRAITNYRVEKIMDDKCVVSLCPITGRTHQLRVHLSYIGTPIYGDFLYGEEVSGERLHLHCSHLSFIHPTKGNEITVNAPLWDDMK